MDSATRIFLSTPLIVPVVGIFAAICAMSILSLVVYAIMDAFMRKFNKSRTDARSDGLWITLTYGPGLQQVASSVSIVKDSSSDLVDSITSLASVNPLGLLFIIAIGLAGIFYYFQNPVIHEQLGIFKACWANPAIDTVKELANLARFLLGIAWPIVNYISFLSWSITGILLRSTLHCGLDLNSTVITNFFVSIYVAVRELSLALKNFFLSADLMHARIDLLTFVFALGAIPQAFNTLTDCLCNYLTPIVSELLAILQTDSMMLAVDYLVNAGVRLVQAIPIALTNLEFPQITPAVIELIPGLYATGLVAEDVVRIVVNMINDWLNLIPIAAASDPRARDVLMSSNPVLAEEYTSASGTPTFASLLIAAQHPDTISIATAFNLTDLIGFTYVLALAQTPWSRVPVGVAAAILAAANQTWSWSLLLTRATLSDTDVKYFQWGYVLDYLRDAGWALGLVAAAFDPRLEIAVGDIGLILSNAVQIVLELVTKGIFTNAYHFPSDGNIFAYTVKYCNGTSELPMDNYRLMYNHSASLGLLFGCDPTLDTPAFPIESAGSVCVNNVLACLVLNLYRLAVEVVDFLEKFACYFSEIVQFNGTSGKATFADLTILKVWRSFINLGLCLKNLIYLLDVLSLGDPVGKPCESPSNDPTQPVLYKKAFACFLGNFVDATWLMLGSLIYEIARMARGLLIYFAYLDDFHGREIQIPTLTNALKNLDVAICNLGGLIGSIFPVTFSCSAQSEAQGGLAAFTEYVSNPVPGPATHAITVANLPDRVSAYCTYNRSQWAQSPSTPCNCTGTTYKWTTGINALSNLSCVLECSRPGVTFPLILGSDPVSSFTNCTPAGADFMNYTTITWTNASTLRQFLTASNALTTITGFLSGVNLVDPVASSLPYGPFLSELITAFLNDRFNREFNGKYRVMFRPFEGNYATCTNNSAYNATYHVFANKADVTLVPNDPGPHIFANPSQRESYVSMQTIIDFAITSIFGGATNLPNTLMGFDGCLYPTTTSCNMPTTLEALDAQILRCLLLFGGYGNQPEIEPGDPARIWLTDNGNQTQWLRMIAPFTYMLRLYNSAFPSCSSAYDGTADIPNATSCFRLDRQAGPRAPTVPMDITNISSIINSTVYQNNVSLNELCTWTPFLYALSDTLPVNSSICNCTDLLDLFYFGGPLTGACLIYCDSVTNFTNLFPVVIGNRRDECNFGDFCKSHAYEYSTLAHLMTDMEATGVPAGNQFSMDGIDGFFPQDMAFHFNFFEQAFLAELLAARLNLHYMKQAQPRLFFYMRPIYDPLNTPTCVADNTPTNISGRQLFSNQRVDIVVSVLERYAMSGVLSFSHRCSFFYLQTDLEYKFCTQLDKVVHPQDAGTLSNIMAYTLLPYLQSWNRFRVGCNASVVNVSNECFFATTFSDAAFPSGGVGGDELLLDDIALPPLDFVSVEYAALLDLTVDTIKPCHSTIEGGTNFFCSLGRTLVAPLYLVAGILEQINIAISGSNGQWTLGSGIWELLKLVLLTVWSRLGVTFLAAMTGLDCIRCAIGGNKKYIIVPQNVNVFGEIVNADCAALLFTYWLPIVQFIARIGTAIITGTVDLLRLITLVIYYFFSSQFGLLVQAIFQFLISYMLDVIIPLLEGIMGFIVGLVCACNAWNLVVPADLQCTNMGYCGGKKRSIQQLQSNVTFDYQLFAADWPTPGYSWPYSNPCNASMPLLATLAPNSLTKIQGREASFCLSQLTVFTDNTVLYDGGPMSFSYCHETVDGVAAARTPWTQLSAMEQAGLTECVHSYGLVYAHKQEGGSILSWLPTQALSTHDGGLLGTWIPLAFDSVHAFNAQQQSWRDTQYTSDVRNSVDYQARMTQEFGPDRAKWAAQGGAPNMALYAESSLNGGASSRKRQVGSAPPSPQRIQRVTAMAETIQFLAAGLNQNFPAMYQAKLQTRMAALPPLPVLVVADTQVANTGVYESTSTGNMGFMPDTNQTSLQSITTSADRAMHTVLNIVSQSLTPTPDPFTGSKKRGFGENAPSIGLVPYLMTTGVANFWTTARELMTGKAVQNATGARGGAKTIVPWKLANPTAASMPDAEKNRRYNAAWNLFAGNHMLKRYRDRNDALRAWSTKLAAISASDTTGRIGMRSKRMSELGQLFHATFRGDALALSALGTADLIGDICNRCLILCAYISYHTIAANITLSFYTNSHAARPEATVQYLIDDFDTVTETLFNSTKYVIIGNSPLNPARFPSPVRAAFNYIDDPVTNKIGLTDVQPLVDRTVALWNSLIGDLSLNDSPGISSAFVRSAATVSTGMRAGMTAADRRARVLERVKSASALPRTTSSSLFEVKSMVIDPGLAAAKKVAAAMAAFRASSTSPANGSLTAAAFDWADAGTLAVDWGAFALNAFIFCSWNSELDGSGIRFSLFVGGLIFAVPVALLLGLAIVIPTVGNVVFSLSGGMGILVYAGLVLSYTAGWSLLCAPALPTPIWTVQLMYLLFNQIFSPCNWAMDGGVMSDEYDNTNCYSCDTWRSGEFAFIWPPDLGWTTPFDPIVFPFRQFDFPMLQTWRNPANYIWPFSSLIGSQTVQEQLTKWDNVEMSKITDPLVYSWHWFSWPVTALAWFMMISLVTLLISKNFKASFTLIGGMILLVLTLGALLFIAWARIVMMLFAAAPSLTPPPRSDEEDEGEEELSVL